MKLIDKDVLVAEIDRRLHQLTDAAFDSMIGRNLIEIKDFLDTLDVKEMKEEPVSEEYACRLSSSKYGHDKVKDSFIEKAVNWLINNTDITPTGIKNFRKAMK